MVSDKGHGDGGEEGRQQHSCKSTAAAFLPDSARSWAQLSNILICTSYSHYFVYGFQGRMCLHLHLSNSKLLAPSNDVLDAAAEEEIVTGINGGLPTVFFLHCLRYSQGWLGYCDRRITQESQAFCFALLLPLKSTSVLCKI